MYLGASLAQAAMELLVHLYRPSLLTEYSKMSVAFDEALVNHIDIADLPDDWAEPTLASAVREVGDRWAQGQSSLVLQVPSASVIGEYNFLLNPGHPDFGQLRLVAMKCLPKDEREKHRPTQIL